MIINLGIRRTTINTPASALQLYQDLSGKLSGSVTFTRNSGQYEKLADGSLTRYSNNVAAFDLFARTGILLEPAATNKCICYGVPPTNTYATTQTAGQVMRQGGVYEIVARTTLDFGTVGTLLSGSANTVGAQYLITSASATLGASDQAKQDLGALQTKAYHNGTAFVNPMVNTSATAVMTLSGDTSAVLSVVDDTAALTAAGLLGITNGGKVYKLITGATAAQVDVAGAMTAVITSLSVYMAVTSGTGTLSDSAGANASTSTAATYTKKTVENFTATATRTLRISGAANTTLYFILPQLEASPFATSVNPSVGSAGDRIATVLSVSVNGNLPTSGIRRISLNWTPRGVPVGGANNHLTPQYLWSTRVDASNYTAIWYNGVVVAMEKCVGGQSEFVTYTLAPVAGTTYKIDGWINSDNTMGLAVNGVRQANSLGSELITQPFNLTQASLPYQTNGTKTSSSVATATTTSLYVVTATLITRGKIYQTLINASTNSAAALNVIQAGPIAFTTMGQPNSVVSAALTQSTPSIGVRMSGNLVGETITITGFSVKEVYNNSTTAAPQIGTTMEIGSLNGVSNFCGNINSFAIYKR